MKTITILFIITLSVLMAETPAIIMAPYNVIPAGRYVELWGMIDDSRDKFDQAQYSWEFVLPDGLIRQTADGTDYYDPWFGYYVSFEKSKLTGKVHDGWNVCTNQLFRLPDNVKSLSFTATLTVTPAAGAPFSASRQYTVIDALDFTSREKAEQWRKYAIISALHWLQKRQRPCGGWPDCLWDAYQLFTEYDDQHYLEYMQDIQPNEIQDSYHVFCSTASVIWAFGNCGFGLDNLKGNPFRRTVVTALDYIAGQTSFIQLAGMNVLGIDGNKNGQGASLGKDGAYRGYTQPMALAAILASGDPSHTVTIQGKQCSLRNLAEDAFDYTAWTLFRWGKSAWPYDYDVNSGFDLSIAGWNFIVLESVGNWGICVPSTMLAECLRLLYQNHNTYTGGFSYSQNEHTHTIALTAAAIVGHIIASNAAPLQDASYLCPDIAMPAGKLAISAMRHLPKIIQEKENTLNTGYFSWTLIRAFQSAGIKNYIYKNEITDWRYAQYDKGGLWHRILRQQNQDGYWFFNYEDFTYGYYSHEKETAFMLLALSDEVVHKSNSINNIRIQTQIPISIAEALYENKFSDMTYHGQSVTLEYNRKSMDSSEKIDLDISYFIPEGEAGTIPVQDNLKVTYSTHADIQEEITRGPLFIERRGELYDLLLEAPELANVGDEVPISITCILPQGEDCKMVKLSTSDTTIQYDKNVKWTYIVPQDSQISSLDAWFLPSRLLEKWLPVTLTKNDSGWSANGPGGEVLRLTTNVPQAVNALVYHISSDFDICLEISQDESGYRLPLSITNLTSDDFGKSIQQQHFWQTAGQTQGLYSCRASLLKNGSPLITKKSPIRLIADKDYSLQNHVATDKLEYIKDEDAIVSSAVSIVNAAGIDHGANVKLSVVSSEDDFLELFSTTWRIERLCQSDSAANQFIIPLYTTGSFTVNQTVLADDGKSWSDNTSFTVYEATPSPALLGFFHEKEIIVEKPNPIIGKFTVEDAGNDAGGSIEAVVSPVSLTRSDIPEDLSNIQTSDLQRNEIKVLGNFSLESTENLPSGKYMLALSGKSKHVSQELLDIAYVTINEPSPEQPPIVLEPEDIIATPGQEPATPGQEPAPVDIPGDISEPGPGRAEAIKPSADEKIVIFNNGHKNVINNIQDPTEESVQGGAAAGDDNTGATNTESYSVYSMHEVTRSSTKRGNIRQSTAVPEINMMLAAHNLHNGKPLDVMEIILPNDWPETGILNIDVDSNGFQQIKECHVCVTRANDYPLPNPLMTINFTSIPEKYTLAATRNLYISGKRNTFSTECEIIAGNLIDKSDCRNLSAIPASPSQMERFRAMRLSMPANAILLTGGLKVSKGEELQPGIYFVQGNVRFYGSASGPVTIIATGNMVIRSENLHISPKLSNLLFLADKGIFLLGSDNAFKGDICSLESEVRVYGKRLYFSDGGIHGKDITIKGTANSFLASHSIHITTE